MRTTRGRWLFWAVLGVAGMACAAASELRGKVVEVEADRLYVQEAGRVIELDVDEDTRLEGIPSLESLSAGDEVRASFTLEGTRNAAVRIQAGPPPEQDAHHPVSNPLTEKSPALIPSEGESVGPASPLPMED